MRRRIAAAMVAACAALALLAAPAAAQSDDDPAEPVTLELVEFTGTLRPEGEFRMLVRIRNPNPVEVDGLSLLATLHRRTTSRLDYEQAVDAGEVGGVFSAFAQDLEPLPARGTRALEITQAAADLRFGRPADKYGVYPLILQLERDTEPIDEVRTSLVFAEPQVARPLNVGLVVPVDAPPGILPDGSYAGSRVTTTLGPGGRVATLVDALAETRLPVTVAHSGLLLEQAGDLADGYTARTDAGAETFGPDSPGALAAAETLAQVREIAARPATTQLALSFGPADLVALERGGMGSEAARLLSDGQQSVEQITGNRPADRIAWPPDGLDQATLAQLLGAGVDTVVLDERYLAVAPDRDLSFTPSPVRRLRTGTGASITALVPDPFLESALRRTETAAATEMGAAVSAQRIVGETAAVYYERPNAELERGLLIAPPQVWNPPRGLLTQLLDGLADAPWVEPVGLPELARRVPPAESSVGLAYPRAAEARELPADYIADLEEARTTLGSLERLLADDAGTTNRLDDLLRRAASVHYRGALRPEGRQLIATVRDAVDEVASAVTVVQGTPVTLTSQVGRVPITFTNTSDAALDVRVRFESTYFTFENGGVETLELAPDSTVTVAFDVEALTPGGTYPVRVVVEDAEGVVQLASGQLVIRSTAYSVAALVVTGGAAVFLLAWWIRDARRRRSAAASATGEAPRRRGAA